MIHFIFMVLNIAILILLFYAYMESMKFINECQDALEEFFETSRALREILNINERVTKLEEKSK